ncbi:MAG: SGNH/GDSL hydrolase family protein [Opitutales bacterium]|nr:SGNH/GDSL hydrolase family protein [Opitutales bacterium]
MKKITLYAGLSLLALLLLVEISLRSFLGLGNPPLSVEHPEIHYMFKPNQDIQRFGNRIKINEFGMRSEDFSADKPEDEFRILIFGDSVVNGGNLTDQEDLATSLLKEKLQPYFPNGVTVGNVSAGSWGPGNWLAYAEEFGFFEADKVFLVISSHDSADMPTFAPLNPNTHPTQKPLLATSELLIRYVLPRAGIRLGRPDHTGPGFTLEERMETSLNDLEAFLQKALDTEAEVRVFHHWELPEIEAGEAKEGFAFIKEVVESLDIPFHSMHDTFAQQQRDGPSPYRDNIHPNETGQELLAKEIFSTFPTKRP